MLQEYYMKNKERSLCPQLQRRRGGGKCLDPKLHIAKKRWPLCKGFWLLMFCEGN